MQDLIAIVIAITAAAFLTHRGWQRIVHRRSAACGACSKCPANVPANPIQLVNITPPMSRAEAQRRGESA